MNNMHLQWAIADLNEKGYQLQSNIPDVIQDNPWAIVYRFKTHQGFIFLKKVPLGLSLEPKVINLLRTEFQANVPLIITENPTQCCFLMEDAGIQLHHYFKKNFRADILIDMISTYTKLQITTISKTQRFIDIGIPDWRLEKLPSLYQDLIMQETLLIEDGLSKDDLIKLKQLKSKLSSLCELLASYKIKDTFCHSDFHDKNILINLNTYKTTLIDLGEVVITYPFFSFHNCLHMAKENFSLTPAQYHHLQLTCLEPWLELESQKNLFAILSIIKQCGPIHAALGEYHLMKKVDQCEVKRLKKGRFANKLRYWLNQ